MSQNYRTWPILIFLTVISFIIFLLYFYFLLDTVTNQRPGTIWPSEFTLEHWRFLIEPIEGRQSIWRVTLNTIIFASSVTLIVVFLSSTAAYALSRLNFPFRSAFLGGILVLHAFPSVTLLIAIFIILQFLGLYDTLQGVILVITALELPLGIWLMKGFYDTIPWESEMAAMTDGASRFRIWWQIMLPQVRPGLFALGIFAFLSGWGSFLFPLVLAPSADVQVLSVYLSSLIDDLGRTDFSLFKAVGLFYMLPVVIFYLFTQDKLMNVFGGAAKG